MTIKIGLLVNPIAGMGGKVGLKGTDNVVTKAKTLGAKPQSPKKTEETLTKLRQITKKSQDIHWYTCKGKMGEDELKNTGYTQITTIYKPKTHETTTQDTKKACEELQKYSVDLLVFCGGDGTARDIYDIVQNTIPLLGIPSGVKMHSAVFGITTNATATILKRFLEKTLTLGEVEIMDLDEERYRNGEWNIKLFGIAKGIVEPTYIQVGKTTFESTSEDTIREELTEHIEEELSENPDTLYLFGPGGTIEYIADHLHLENTLLGIDAVYNKKTIQTDCNEKQILSLCKNYTKAKILLSPIGAQGFILGRGNLQLSPKVIKKIGIDNIIILATPSKLTSTPYLRVDTGDNALDKKMFEKEFFMVLIGYRFSRVVKIQTNNF